MPGTDFVRSIGGVFTHTDIINLCARNSVDKSTVLRTQESEVQILPGVPSKADVVQW